MIPLSSIFSVGIFCSVISLKKKLAPSARPREQLEISACELVSYGINGNAALDSGTMSASIVMSK